MPVRQFLKAASLAFAFAVWPLAVALPQTPVATQPSGSTTQGGNVSGTIAATNTFQTLWPATGPGTALPARKGCLIINPSTHTMFISEGVATGSATTATSVPIGANYSFTCSFGGVVWTGNIAITGTSGDAFYASQF